VAEILHKQHSKHRSRICYGAVATNLAIPLNLQIVQALSSQFVDREIGRSISRFARVAPHVHWPSLISVSVEWVYLGNNVFIMTSNGMLDRCCVMDLLQGCVGVGDWKMIMKMMI
jgi:hypothetical protein